MNPETAAPCLHLPAPDRFERGDKRRFHWRVFNGGYEVYSIGLDQWAVCNSPEHAATIADALETFYERLDERHNL